MISYSSDGGVESSLKSNRKLDGKNKRLIVFPGQGSQALQMGRSVFETYTSAQEVFDMADQILGYSLSSIIFGNSNEELCKTYNTQTSMLVVSIAIVRAIEQESEAKIEDIAYAVGGHSLGEYVALCAAGSLQLEDALHLLRFRGEVMARACEQNPGAMIAVIGSSVEVIATLIDAARETDVLVMANDNSSAQVVVSGNKEALIRFEVLASEKNIKTIKLNVAGAFHSPLMQSANDDFIEKLTKVNFAKPSVPVLCNVSAKFEVDPEVIKSLLMKQIVSPVRWREAMLFAENSGVAQIVEIGSGKVLTGLTKKTVPNIGTVNIETADSVAEFVKSLFSA